MSNRWWNMKTRRSVLIINFFIRSEMLFLNFFLFLNKYNLLLKWKLMTMRSFHIAMMNGRSSLVPRIINLTALAILLNKLKNEFTWRFTFAVSWVAQWKWITNSIISRIRFIIVWHARSVNFQDTTSHSRRARAGTIARNCNFNSACQWLQSTEKTQILG